MRKAILLCLLLLLSLLVACDDGSNDLEGEQPLLECQGDACTDSQAQLSWTIDVEKDLNWQEAIDYCNGLEKDGSSDWHLPNIDELRSLIRGCEKTISGGECSVALDCLEYECINVPASDSCAPCSAGVCYWDNSLGSDCGKTFWSSSSVSDAEKTAWIVGFYNGGINSDETDKKLAARCVKGEAIDSDGDDETDSDKIDGDETSDGDAEIDLEETEGDEATDGDKDSSNPGDLECQDVGGGILCEDDVSGLMWQSENGEAGLAYQAALDYCENLVYGGHDDWRVPNIDELRSLVLGCDKSATGGVCNVSVSVDCLEYTCRVDDDCKGCSNGGSCFWPGNLGGSCDNDYWSSSVVEDAEETAWMIGFYSAAINSNPKTTSGNMNVRCVR